MELELPRLRYEERPGKFRVDPNIFKVEDLVLDRLYANLVECRSSIELCDLMLKNDLEPEERKHYETRAQNDLEQEELLRALIVRRREYEKEIADGQAGSPS